MLRKYGFLACLAAFGFSAAALLCSGCIPIDDPQPYCVSGICYYDGQIVD